METQYDSLKDRLLAQGEPDAERLAVYRKEMQAMLEQNEKILQRHKWYASGSWVFAILMTMAFLVLGGLRKETPAGVFWSLFGGVLLISAAVELLKCFLNRTRLELLKEIKGLEMQLLEIKDQLRADRR